MRLLDLDPRWLSEGVVRRGMGMAFECPIHRNHHLAVFFANPIDGGPPAAAHIRPTPRWKRTGETFETIGLSPSVDASMNCRCGKLNCAETGDVHTRCWHGFVTDGQIA